MARVVEVEVGGGVLDSLALSATAASCTESQVALPPPEIRRPSPSPPFLPSPSPGVAAWWPPGRSPCSSGSQAGRSPCK